VCGGIEVTGGYYRYISNFSATMGWDGIMIANISGRNPIALIFVSFVWGMLKTGAMNMERATTLNRLTVNLLQMIFVLLVSINYEGIISYIKNKWNKRKIKNQIDRDKEGEYVQ
jgi:simple sugar transport system permease protein